MDEAEPLAREILRTQRGRILSLLAERGARDVRVSARRRRGDEDSLSDIDLLRDIREAIATI